VETERIAVAVRPRGSLEAADLGAYFNGQPSTQIV